MLSCVISLPSLPAPCMIADIAISCELWENGKQFCWLYEVGEISETEVRDIGGPLQFSLTAYLET